MRTKRSEFRGPYKGVNLKLDWDVDSEIISFLEKKKEEGMSLSGYLRKLIREDMRKEKHADKV